jgi:hypothetical protein
LDGKIIPIRNNKKVLLKKRMQKKEAQFIPVECDKKEKLITGKCEIDTLSISERALVSPLFSRKIAKILMTEIALKKNPPKINFMRVKEFVYFQN